MFMFITGIVLIVIGVLSGVVGCCLNMNSPTQQPLLVVGVFAAVVGFFVLFLAP